jgi:hypothetical protein
VFRIIPFILRTRVDAQNFFSEDIPIDHIEPLSTPGAKKSRTHGHARFHAALVRWRRNVRTSTALSCEQNLCTEPLQHLDRDQAFTDRQGEETLIKPVFDLRDTLADVVRRTTRNSRQPSDGKKNSSDVASRVLALSRRRSWRAGRYLRLSDNVG